MQLDQINRKWARFQILIKGVAFVVEKLLAYGLNHKLRLGQAGLFWISRCIIREPFLHALLPTRIAAQRTLWI